jgi:hypothetical protein
MLYQTRLADTPICCLTCPMTSHLVLYWPRFASKRVSLSSSSAENLYLTALGASKLMRHMKPRLQLLFQCWTTLDGEVGVPLVIIRKQEFWTLSVGAKNPLPKYTLRNKIPTSQSRRKSLVALRVLARGFQFWPQPSLQRGKLSRRLRGKELAGTATGFYWQSEQPSLISLLIVV